MKTDQSKSPSPPDIKGHIEVTRGKEGVVIAADPQGLRSIAEMLIWLADVDQSEIKGMPDGEREHVHLTPGFALSLNSIPIELCRLDAKGSGKFPKGYKPIRRKTKKAAVPQWRFREE